MVLLAVTLALAWSHKDTLPDNRRYRWVYEGLKLTQDAGLLNGYAKFTLSPPKLMSRYEIAVAVYATGTNLKTIDQEFKEALDTFSASQPESRNAKDAESTLGAIKKARFDRCFRFMERAEKEFSPEFKTLGATPNLITDETKEFNRLSREKPTQSSL